MAPVSREPYVIGHWSILICHLAGVLPKSPLYCAFCRFSQPRECRRILKRDVGQNFSIHLHAGLLQSENELIVIHAILAGRGTNTDNPQAPEVAFPHFPITIRVAEGLIDRLFGKFVQLALVEIVTLCQTEQLFPAVMSLGS